MTRLLVLPEWARIPVGRAADVPESRTIALDAARGEVASFQIQVCPDAPCRIMLAGTEAYPVGLEYPERWEIDWSWYEELPITVNPTRPGVPRLGTGTYYDGLRPVGDGLDATAPVAVWVDLRAPDVAGDFTAELMVRAGRDRLSVHVALHVHDFTLETPSIPFVTFVNPSKLDRHDGPWRERIGAYMDLARAHGMTPLVPGWASADPVLAPYATTSRYWIAPVPLWYGTPYPNPSEPLEPYLTQHLASGGVRGPERLLHIYNEPEHAQAMGMELNWPEEGVEYYRAVKAAHPDLTVMVDEGLDAGTLASCDILASKAEKCIVIPARRQWAYQTYEGGLPLVTVDRLAPGLRAWPWIAKRYGIEAVRTWCLQYWSDDPFVVPDPQYGDGNGVLCYPGALPTIRLKEIRRGMQDLAIIEAAAARNQLVTMARLAHMVPSGLSEGSGWENDPAEYDEQIRALRVVAE